MNAKASILLFFGIMWHSKTLRKAFELAGINASLLLFTKAVSHKM